MVRSKSKGATRLNKKGMKEWEQRIQKAKENQEQRQRDTRNSAGAVPAPN